jgi:hypothetical protein
VGREASAKTETKNLKAAIYPELLFLFYKSAYQVSSFCCERTQLAVFIIFNEFTPWFNKCMLMPQKTEQLKS